MQGLRELEGMVPVISVGELVLIRGPVGSHSLCPMLRKEG